MRRGRYKLTLPRAGTTRGRERRGRWIAAGQRDVSGTPLETPEGEKHSREEAVEETGKIVDERGRQID